MVTREEHIAWCKKRALEYLDRNDLVNACSSMSSDLGKNPETKCDPLLAMLGMMAVRDNDPAALRRWIEGFH